MKPVLSVSAKPVKSGRYVFSSEGWGVGGGNLTITNAAGGARALCGDSRFVLHGAVSVFTQIAQGDAGYTPSYHHSHLQGERNHLHDLWKFIRVLIGPHLMTPEPKLSLLRTYFFRGIFFFPQNAIQISPDPGALPLNCSWSLPAQS